MPNVQLETLDERWVADIQRLASDPEVSRWSNIPHPYPDDGAIQFVERCERKRAEGNFTNFAITADGEFAVSLSVLDIRQEKVGEISYWIGRPFWGRGAATAAVGLMVRYGFETLGLDRIVARCLEGNVGSWKVAEKAGFACVRRSPNDLPKWGKDEVLREYELRGDVKR